MFRLTNDSGCFADLPSDLAKDLSTTSTIHIVEEEDPPPTKFPFVEMRGEVVAMEADGFCLVSAGGLLVRTQQSEAFLEGHRVLVRICATRRSAKGK